GGEALLARSWPTAVAALLAQQGEEPAEERRLRETMPWLTPIEDHVSLEVRSQYEENPYPHWVRLPLVAQPVSLNDHGAGMFPLAPLETLANTGTTEILIAGCGTGLQPLDTASRLADARFLAVDLSLSSLAYAKRKTRELGFTNIEFAQADILKLGALGRVFDAIEATGVLHHLGDPWAGWETLLRLLAPGGVMRLGFYSEIARRDLAAARRFIAAQGYGSTADDIRRCRQELMSDAADKSLRAVKDFWDFFSISECRDLLFHVPEHRLSLPAIKSFLADHTLQFLGFETDEPTVRRYMSRFPHDRAGIDLDCWHLYETENPRTFLGMYQFWVQKPRAPATASAPPSS